MRDDCGPKSRNDPSRVAGEHCNRMRVVSELGGCVVTKESPHRMPGREDVRRFDVVVLDGPRNHVPDEIGVRRIHVPAVILIRVWK